MGSPNLDCLVIVCVCVVDSERYNTVYHVAKRKCGQFGTTWLYIRRALEVFSNQGRV